MELLDNCIPFPDLLCYPYQLEKCPELEHETSHIDGAYASDTSGSLLLTPKLDAESNGRALSFNDDSGAGVDDDFIHQISCFSNAEVKRVDEATDGLSRCPERRIFARSTPLVLLEPPTETDKWTEHVGPVRLSGLAIEVSGWEPSDKDGLEDWESLRERKFSGGCVSEDTARTMDSSNSKLSKKVNKYYWGRRMTSNRHVPKIHKKRQDGNPEKTDQQLLEHDAIPFRDTSETCLTQTMHTASENSCLGQHKAASLFHIPSYIFPQPAIARLITQVAVENECQPSLADNFLLLDQYCAEAEVTRRLVDEFLDIPEDTKEEIMDFGGSCEKPYSEPFGPIDRTSIVTAGGIGHNIRAEGVPPKFSTSTRRRAISYKPQFRVNASKSSAKTSVGEGAGYFKLYQDSATTQRVGCDSIGSGMDTLPARKHGFDEDETTDSERSAKRVRF